MQHPDLTKNTPLVTVVLTACNHENYVKQALESVLFQHYSNIQLIVIDNASTDLTQAVIENIRQTFRSFVFIKNPVNAGLCKAFNQGLALAEGKYIIDLSGDDVLLPDRVERQVDSFERCSPDYAVVFSNAGYIDAQGNFLGYHDQVNPEGKAARHVPSGDVYKMVLKKYFICTPTMMIRTNVLREMGGYDESLLFEDFDFWVRSAVRYKYFYQDEVLTLKRKVPHSLSSKVYENGSGMLRSYYAVCIKAYDLNRDQEEFDLLAGRIRTFIRKCFYAEEFELASKFRQLLNKIQNPDIATEAIILLCRMKIPVNRIYRFYIKNLYNFYSAGRI